MPLFSKDQTKDEPEEYGFDFSVLWQDEEPSSLLKYIFPTIEIILIIVILAKVWGLK